MKPSTPSTTTLEKVVRTSFTSLPPVTFPRMLLPPQLLISLVRGHRWAPNYPSAAFGLGLILLDFLGFFFGSSYPWPHLLKAGSCLTCLTSFPAPFLLILLKCCCSLDFPLGLPSSLVLDLPPDQSHLPCSVSACILLVSSTVSGVSSLPLCHWPPGCFHSSSPPRQSHKFYFIFLSFNYRSPSYPSGRSPPSISFISDMPFKYIFFVLFSIVT